MVRIRSNRWYSGENQKELRRTAPSNSSGTRRLVSMVFLLVLVLVLMSKVSDPKNMRQIFESLGIPLEQQVVATSDPQPGSGDSPSQAGTALPNSTRHPTRLHADTPWDKTCADLIPRLLDNASPGQIDQLAEYWFATVSPSKPGDKAPVPLSLDSLNLIEQLRETLDDNSGGDNLWSELLTQFGSRWQAVIEEANQFHRGEIVDSAFQAKLPLDEFHQRLSDQLDRRMLDNLRDGSPWRTGEIVSFGRLLQRGKNFQFGLSDPPLVNTQQLEGDFLKLRGSWVRYRATVRMIEQVDREQPLVNQANYSVMWVRGFDGSTQPIPVYTTSSIVNQLQRSLSPQSYPEVEIIGLVSKKLAYGSAAGVEVSPTLFAGSIIQFATALAENKVPQDGLAARQIVITGFAGLVLSLIAIVFVWKQLRPSSRNRTQQGTLTLPVGLGFMLFCWAVDTEAVCAQEPPWKSSSAAEQVKSQIVQQRLQSAFDEQRLQQIQQLLQGGDTSIPDAILQTLFALNQVGWDRVWQAGNKIKLSANYELKPVELVGWAWSVQSLALSPQQQDWFSAQPTKNIYRIQMQTAPSKDQQPPELISVFCREVPRNWQESVQLKQPAQFRCFSFSNTPDPGNEGLPQFYLAERAIWKLSDADLLRTAEFHPQIPQYWLQLARSGWDLAWFDLLAANNQKRLSQEETEPLLKLLEMAKPTGESSTPIEPLTKPIDAMSKPIEHLLSSIAWQVRLVSGSIVDLSRPGESIRYYQFDGFVKIPNQTINYSIPDTAQSLSFKNEFPVTILTRHDGEFVPLDKLRAGAKTWQIGKTVKVQGRFMRLWSYESQRLSTTGSTSRQVAPLIVASTLTPISALPEVSQTSIWSVAVLGCAMLFIMAWVLKDFIKKSSRPIRR